MRTLLLGAAIAAGLMFAPASVAKPAAPAVAQDVVLERDVRITQYPIRVRGSHIRRDGSIVLDGQGGRFYRITLNSSCARTIRPTSTLFFNTRPSDTLDRLDLIGVDWMRCRIEALDRIERPIRETRS